MPAILLIIGVVVVGGIAAMLILPSEDMASENEPTARVEEVNDNNTVVESEDSTDDTVVDETNSEPDANSSYVDGTYTYSGEYLIPAGSMEPYTIALTLENDVVTDTNLSFDGIVGTSRLRQARFTEAHEAEIIGKDIDELDLAAVGGSSLTTGAFNEALANIKVQASS